MLRPFGCSVSFAVERKHLHKAFLVCQTIRDYQQEWPQTYHSCLFLVMGSILLFRLCQSFRELLFPLPPFFLKISHTPTPR